MHYEHYVTGSFFPDVDPSLIPPERCFAAGRWLWSKPAQPRARSRGTASVARALSSATVPLPYTPARPHTVGAGPSFQPSHARSCGRLVSRSESSSESSHSELIGAQTSLHRRRAFGTGDGGPKARHSVPTSELSPRPPVAKV